MINASEALVCITVKKKAFTNQRRGWNDDMRIEWNYTA
jgi:hypothetical protein